MLYKAKTLPKYLKQQGRINRIICYKANLMVHPPKIQRPFLNLLHLCQYMGVIKKKKTIDACQKYLLLTIPYTCRKQFCCVTDCFIGR